MCPRGNIGVFVALFQTVWLFYMLISMQLQLTGNEHFEAYKRMQKHDVDISCGSYDLCTYI